MPRGRPKHDDILTPREWEVLGLLRRGRTNEQIAADLGISENGAKYHVAEILSKLGVSSRHEAARWQPEMAPRWGFGLGVLQSLRGPALVAAAAAVAIAIFGLGAGVYLMESRKSGEGTAGSSLSEVPATPQEFLFRVQTALTSGDQIAYVQANTEVVSSNQSQVLWSAQSWLNLSAQTSRTVLRKAPGASIDMASEQVDIVNGEYFYRAYPQSDGPVTAYLRKEEPACFRGEPDTIIMPLACGFMSLPVSGSMEIEGMVDYQGRALRSLLWHDLTGATQGANRLLVDPDTYLPVAFTLTVPPDAQRITHYDVQFVPRNSLAQNYFDPESLGYEPEPVKQLRILDDPALGVPVYWPGRQMQGPQPQTYLADVEDRSPSVAPAPNEPDTRLTLVYAGDKGRFRLDYWPPGAWEEHKQRLGQSFAWAACSDRVEVPGGPPQVIILRGFDPMGGALVPPPSIATPGVAPSTPQPPNPFPTGCPSGPYQRFMAEIHYPEVTITVNAQYWLILEPSQYFGSYNTQAGLEEIARNLHLRQPGE